MRTKQQLKAEAIIAHNLEHEKRMSETPAEKDIRWKNEVREIARKTAADAHESLFGNGKPKKVKRWK